MRSNICDEQYVAWQAVFCGYRLMLTRLPLDFVCTHNKFQCTNLWMSSLTGIMEHMNSHGIW